MASPSSPEGGMTPGVWVVDATPPALLLVDAYAASQATIHLRLQLSEPGTIWSWPRGRGGVLLTLKREQSERSALRCAPLATDNASFCSLDDMAANITVGCDYERFIKDQQPLQAGMGQCCYLLVPGRIASSRRRRAQKSLSHTKTLK